MVATSVLPPGDNPIAVNIYIKFPQNIRTYKPIHMAPLCSTAVKISDLEPYMLFYMPFAFRFTIHKSCYKSLKCYSEKEISRKI